MRHAGPRPCRPALLEVMRVALALWLLCRAVEGIQLYPISSGNDSASLLMADGPAPPPPPTVDGQLLPLSSHLQILRQMQAEALLPAGDGLGLTLCGDFPPELGPPPALRDETVTLRTCRDCQRQFRAELLGDRPMMPRALLMGTGCRYWPGAQPLPHWSPRSAALLGRLDCRAAPLRPELDRLPDLLCLQLDSAAGRSGRLFRRTFALRSVREVGSWSSVDGLRVTDRRTGVQSNGLIISDGSPLRVAYVPVVSKRLHCQKSPHDNRTCANVYMHTRLPAFSVSELELNMLQIPKTYNMTLEILDPQEFPVRPARGRLGGNTARALGLMIAGGADRTWPSSVLGPWTYRLPISAIDSGEMSTFTFMTVCRPSQLDASSLFRLYSPGTWAAIVISTALVAALLSRVLRRDSAGGSATVALALLLGQSLPLGADRLPPRHRPLVAVWVAMSLILTAAFLSDLIMVLTVPRSQPPRTAQDLVTQNYRLFTDFPHIRRHYTHSPRPLVRQLGRDMRAVPFGKLTHTLLHERSAYSMGRVAMLETMAEAMFRSQGSVQFEDFALGEEAFGHMLVGQLWSKHHPLLPHRVTSSLRTFASGLHGTRRIEDQARHFGQRVKAQACARRQPSCYTAGVVRPLSVTNLHGPLLLYGAGLVLALLVFLLEVLLARLTERRQRHSVTEVTRFETPIPQPSCSRDSDSQG